MATIPFPTPTPTAAASGAVASAFRIEPVPTQPSLVSSGLAVADLDPLRLPVQGAKVSDLKNDFDETRGGVRRHEAIDILAPRGTPVVAAAAGTVAKLFTSVQGGLTVYEFNRDGTLCYYYAHLDRYAPGLAEGMALSRGDRIGDVGTTGNAPKNTPTSTSPSFAWGRIESGGGRGRQPVSDAAQGAGEIARERSSVVGFQFSVQKAAIRQPTRPIFVILLGTLELMTDH